MKTLTSPKLLSFILSIAFVFVYLPAPNAFAAAVNESPKQAAEGTLNGITPKHQPIHVVYYKNDFESGAAPSYSNPQTSIWWVGSGHGLFFNTSFNRPAAEPDNDVCTVDFNINTTEYPILENTPLQFDLVLPGSSAAFNGTIAFQAAAYTAGGERYNSGTGTYYWVTASDFKDLGNGYCSTHISISFERFVPAGMDHISIQFLGSWNCDYNGMLGIDNIDFEGLIQ